MTPEPEPAPQVASGGNPPADPPFEVVLARQIAAMLDYPSVYMGGPSMQNLRKAERIIASLQRDGIIVDPKVPQSGHQQWPRIVRIEQGDDLYSITVRFNEPLSTEAFEGISAALMVPSQGTITPETTKERPEVSPGASDP